MNHGELLEIEITFTIWCIFHTIGFFFKDIRRDHRKWRMEDDADDKELQPQLHIASRNYNKAEHRPSSNQIN